MARWIVLIALIVGVYYAYTELLPKYESRKAAEADDETLRQLSATCVSAAEGANEALAAEAGGFREVAGNRTLWTSTMVRMAGAIADAERACRCETRSCESAAAALLQERRLLEQLDRAVRGDSSGLEGAEDRQQMIKRLLADARRSLP